MELLVSQIVLDGDMTTSLPFIKIQAGNPAVHKTCGLACQPEVSDFW